MKKVILLFCFMPVTLFSQVSYDFETCSLYGWTQSTNGRWAADSNSSIIGAYSLHHVYDNTEAGTDQIGTRLIRLNPRSGTTRWSFTIRYGADPSSSNNWAVFIMSDSDPGQMQPGGDINGYAIGVNLTGYDDTLRLWKSKAGNLSTVMSVPVNWQTDIGTSKSAIIEVERSATGAWKATIRSGLLERSSTCYEPEIFSIHWFGIYYRYTSTRDRLLWLDDIKIEGPFGDGGLMPGIVKVIPSGLSSLDVWFNEDISPLSALPANFECSPAPGSPQSVTIVDRRKLRLIYNVNLPDRTPCILKASNICDEDSICVTNINFNFTPAVAAPGDVIISEIMADPVPVVSLPAREYLEILNRTGYEFNLHGWRLISETDYLFFPDSVIAPGEMAILCSVSDTGLFSGYSRVIGFRSFPALSDEGKSLMITEGSGKMIHCVSYSSVWYGDKIRSAGGWSLEMIDTGFPFFQEGNWRASESSEGGTPGKRNSVAGKNPDEIFTGLVNVFPADSQTLDIMFSETVRDPADLISKVEVSGIAIDSLISVGINGTGYKCILSSELKKGIIYTLSISEELTDWAGNKAKKKSLRFGLPEDASGDDLVFNELLFNPLPGDADYIELINNSGKIIDANRLFLVSLNDETGDTSELALLSDTGRCILPGSYYAITTMRDRITDRYFSSSDTNVFEVEMLPSMPDDKGHLILFNHRDEMIDEVSYSEKMHSGLLSGLEGISLEKIRPGALSSDLKNWHSASETSGWGTPGSINSVFTEMPGPDKTLSFSSTRITPDNDGFEDLLAIDLRLGGNSNIVTILIFDENGAIIRKLVQNLYCNNEFSVVWDGSADDRSVVSSGIYVILITVFDENGNTRKWKKACSVIR